MSSSNSWTMIIKIAIILIFMHTSHVMVNRCVYVCVRRKQTRGQIVCSSVTLFRYIYIHICMYEEKKRSSMREKIFNLVSSFCLLCTRKNILQISIYLSIARERERERSRNEPLFCKHIHVKIRIDNTRVVVVILSSSERWWRTRTKSLSRIRKRQGLACIQVDFQEITSWRYSNEEEFHLFIIKRHAPVVLFERE